MASVKPLDTGAVAAAARETGATVTVEEVLTTGLGGAVAETVVRHHPVPMRFVGVPDVFAPTGSTRWLFDHFGIGPQGVARAAQEPVGGLTPRPR